MKCYDVVVIGAGIAGASLAHFLAPHRALLLLEREDAAGYHATGRSAAEFTQRFHGSVASRLAAASQPFLSQPPAGFTEIELLRQRGNLLIADRQKADRLRALYAEESARAPGLALLDVEAALERVPFLDPDWVAAAFFDPDCWDIEVDGLLQGFLRSARRNGAEYRWNTEVTRARRSGDRWQLECADDTVEAALVVNAAGAWADVVAARFGATPLGLTPYRRTVINVAADGFDLTAVPEVNEIDERFYFKPDAGQLLVSPADETPAPPSDAQPEELDIAQAAHYLSECTTLDPRRVAHAWAGLRTFAPDRIPVVGPDGAVPGFFWLAGQGGFGIQTSPALGRFAAELVVAGTAETLAPFGIEAATLAPDRLR